MKAVVGHSAWNVFSRGSVRELSGEPQPSMLAREIIELSTVTKTILQLTKS